MANANQPKRKKRLSEGRKPGSGGKREGSGAPLKDFDWDQFEKLCAIQCTILEICAWFDCDDKTLTKAVMRRYGLAFSEAFARFRKKGKVSLRRKQFQKALEGDATMLIWLGKQYLDQTDKRDVTARMANPYLNMSDEELLKQNKQLARLDTRVAAVLESKRDVTPSAEVIDIDAIKSSRPDQPDKD